MRVLEERAAGRVRSTPSAAKRFADALLGRTSTQAVAPAEREGVNRPSRPEQSRLIEHFRWLMAIVPSRAGLYQQQLEERLAEEESVRSESCTFAALLLEAEWDASKHPRRGGPPNGGWFADKGTGTTATGGRGLQVAQVSHKPSQSNSGQKSFLGKIVDRNRQLDDLTGGPAKATELAKDLADTPRRVRSNIKATLDLARDVAAGFESGLKTGEKALINGGATAIKNVATLGLSTSQLELIAVTDEDRANGYDTAVAIATASGEVLITVGTGGLAAALKNGGTVARAASGVLVAYDAAGNAVGVVQGVYDAATNGVSVRNAASTTANALGLPANVRSIGEMAKPRANAEPVTSTPAARQVSRPPRLEPFVPGSKTLGVVRSDAGEFSIQSGRPGPAASMPKGSPGFNAITSTHVEGHTAAYMRQNAIQEATVYINNPRICLPCRQNLAHMLPPNSKLTIVLPDGSSETFVGNSR